MCGIQLKADLFDFTYIIKNVNLQIGGMREGDFIIAIGDKDVKWSSHEEVVRLIHACGDSLTLRLATPMDRACVKVWNVQEISYILIIKTKKYCILHI